MVASTQAWPTRWEDVRLFLALYRERTLAAAGASVRLDASTLSRRLAALEDDLAAQLFERTPEGLLPTEAAELLLPAAEEMATAHARFVRDASGFERAAEGAVRLSVPPGLAELFVAPALVRLIAKYPRLQIELDASLRFADLTRREADIALRTRRPQSGDLVSLKVAERRWLPMLASKRAGKRQAVRAWDELRWIGWGDDMQDFPPAKWLTKHVPSSALGLRTSQIATQLSAVESGFGAALLPPAYARLAAVAPIKTTAALAATLEHLPTSETWLVSHRALRSVPRIAAVWSFLTEELAKFEPQKEKTG